MKLFLFLMVAQIIFVEEDQKKIEADAVFDKMYNHTRVLAADKEAESLAMTLLEKYPLDPYFYNIWASTEWLLMGRELNLKANEQINVGEIDGYRERGQRYRQIVDKGLALTENSNEEKDLFVRAALMFDHAKFSARYESGLSGLRRADKEAVEGVKILKKILEANPNQCLSYFFLGSSRLQLSTKVGFFKKFFVWKFSKVYAELYTIDGDVINENKSVEWLEKSYQCRYAEPLLKKIWLETSFVLVGAYNDLVVKKFKKGPSREEFSFLKKEISLLEQLGSMFPQNQDVVQMLAEKELRLKILQNYFSKK